MIHLVTAALGAERFYSTDNNTTRSETPSQAAEVDLATRRAWLGSPHLRIIGNDGGIDFQTKINMAIAAICQKLGVPGPAGTRKFFVCHSRHRDYVPVRSGEAFILVFGMFPSYFVFHKLYVRLCREIFLAGGLS